MTHPAEARNGPGSAHPLADQNIHSLDRLRAIEALVTEIDAVVSHEVTSMAAIAGLCEVIVREAIPQIAPAAAAPLQHCAAALAHMRLSLPEMADLVNARAEDYGLNYREEPR